MLRRLEPEVLEFIEGSVAVGANIGRLRSEVARLYDTKLTAKFMQNMWQRILGKKLSNNSKSRCLISFNSLGYF